MRKTSITIIHPSCVKYLWILLPLCTFFFILLLSFRCLRMTWMLLYISITQICWLLLLLLLFFTMTSSTSKAFHNFALTRQCFLHTSNTAQNSTVRKWEEKKKIYKYVKEGNWMCRMTWEHQTFNFFVSWI